MHELNISHKEVCPNNYIYSKKDKMWKLNDFGVSINIRLYNFCTFTKNKKLKKQIIFDRIS